MSAEQWQCEHCTKSQTGQPAAKESYPGAELWFCEECTDE